MRRLVLAALVAAAPAFAQVSYPPAAVNGLRQIYASSGSTSVGPSSVARTSMLPPGQPGSSLLIKANTCPIGCRIRIEGYGVISATMLGSPTFTFTPHVTPAGGSRTDLGGMSAAPAIGVVGITWLSMTITQTTTGLQTSGVISYAQANSNNNFPNIINPNMTIVASDPGVDRTIGIDGQWSVSNASNYVITQMVTFDMGQVAP